MLLPGRSFSACNRSFLISKHAISVPYRFYRFQCFCAQQTVHCDARHACFLHGFAAHASAVHPFGCYSIMCCVVPCSYVFVFLLPRLSRASTCRPSIDPRIHLRLLSFRSFPAHGHMIDYLLFFPFVIFLIFIL